MRGGDRGAEREALRAQQEARRSPRAAAYLLDLLSLPYPFDSGSTRQRSLRSLLDSGAGRAHRLTAGGALRSDVYLALSRGYYGLGDFRNAAAMGRHAVALRVAEFGDTAAEVADARVKLAEALQLAGDLRAAEAQYDAALATVRRRQGPRAVVAGLLLHAQARNARARGELARAERLLAEALAIFGDSVRGGGSVPWAHALQTRGHLATERGRLAAAESSYRAAVAMRERIGAAALEIANGQADDQMKLASLALLGGRSANAVRLAEEALARYAAAGEVPFWRLVPALDALGEAELRQGRPMAAEATLRRALGGQDDLRARRLAARR